jgi:BON domain
MAGFPMRRPNTPNQAARPRAPLACVLALLALAGCKTSQPAINDATLAGNIQSTLSADSVLTGQAVQVSVASGVATLTGYVANDAQRAVAARDASGVAGVAKVVNDISVGAPPPASATATIPPPPVPAQTPVKKTTQLLKPVPPHQAAPIERPQPQAYNPPPPPQPAPEPTPAPAPALPAPPPPPPQPTFKTVTVDSGNTIPVRITQTLDSATTQEDTTFSGVVASDIVIDGVVAIPAGSNVTGHVDAVQEAAHFKGSSLLTVSLTGITRRGEHLAVTTDPYTVTGKGRGKNTAEKTGGGAAVGAILGGIFGGGKGAAIGAAAGAGAGAGSQAVTRGEQVQIESESVVRFHLSSPISVKVRTDTGERHGDDGALQPRSN